MANKNHTAESLRAEASKYTSRSEFQKNNHKAYKAARYHGILDDVCAHMQRPGKYSPESLRKIAYNYTTRFDFQKGRKGAYKAALRLGVLDEICKHMNGKSHRKHSAKSLKKIASKYKTRGEFSRSDRGAYSRSQARGLLDGVCAHMEKSVCGFDPEKPATLYYIRISPPLFDLHLYKIGITNRTIQERFSTSELNIIVVIKETNFNLGKDALSAERKIIKNHAEHRYNGPNVLETGNTELFTVDVLGLDNRSTHEYTIDAA